MPNSFTIGTLFGIKIRVHWLFLILPLLIAQFDGGLIYFFMLCSVVLLHELGHSLVAQRFGIRVLDITFWPLGGMARMSQIPEDTKTETLIAIAGPAVNFVLAPLGLIALFAADAVGATVLGEYCAAFIVINLLLGSFNLIPAFPMDGGRVLRAFLGRKGDWVGATEKAVHVGRIVALIMGVVGLFNGQYIVPIIALWLWFAGGQELRAVRMRHQQNPLGNLANFMRQAFGEAAARAAANGSSTYDAPPSHTPRATSAPRAQDPYAAPASDPYAAPGKGISQDDVERLERFRGPLRQYRQGDE